MRYITIHLHPFWLICELFTLYLTRMVRLWLKDILVSIEFGVSYLSFRTPYSNTRKLKHLRSFHTLLCFCCGGLGENTFKITHQWNTQDWQERHYWHRGFTVWKQIIQQQNVTLVSIEHGASAIWVWCPLFELSRRVLLGISLNYLLFLHLGLRLFS